MSLARRGTGNLSYNPLADGNQRDQAADTWHCISGSEVPYYSRPDFGATSTGMVAPGSKVIGKKEGEWIKVTDSQLYVPYKDASGTRLFKNERVIIYEQRKAAGENPGLLRFSSSSSIGSIDWDYPAPQRMTSVKSQMSQASLKSGMSVKSKVSEDFGDQQSVWICSAAGSVPYYSEASYEAETVGLCEPGEKVSAVKQGDWLMVVEVKDSVDVVGALGRRSMRGISRQTSSQDGRFLPFLGAGGERLFKNEKVAAWEQIKNKGPDSEPKKEGNCVLM